MEALSDDYLEEVQPKFILNENERTIDDKQQFLLLLEKIKKNPDS